MLTQLNGQKKKMKNKSMNVAREIGWLKLFAKFAHKSSPLEK